MDGVCFFSQRHVLLWWGEARQVDAKMFWGKVVVPTQFQPFRGNMSVETQGRFSSFPGKQKTTKWSKMQHPESNMANPYTCRTGYVGNMMLDDHDGSSHYPFPTQPSDPRMFWK